MSNVLADKNKRSITITVCALLTRGLDNELKFCRDIIQQHTLLTQCKLDKAKFLAQVCSRFPVAEGVMGRARLY